MGWRWPGICSSWCEGRLGGSGRACSRDELGREEMGGYGSGDEESGELVSKGSMEVRGGMGGRCIMRLTDLDGVGGLLCRLIGTGICKSRGWRSGMRYTHSSGGEWQWERN